MSNKLNHLTDSASQGCSSVTSRSGLDRFSAEVSSKKSMPPSDQPWEAAAAPSSSLVYERVIKIVDFTDGLVGVVGDAGRHTPSSPISRHVRWSPDSKLQLTERALVVCHPEPGSTWRMRRQVTSRSLCRDFGCRHRHWHAARSARPGIEHTHEFGEHAVAGSVRYPALMPGD